MIVGIPKEIKIEEHRVAMTPAGVEVMQHNGHVILVEKNAGMDSGFHNADYVRAGAEIINEPAEIYDWIESTIRIEVVRLEAEGLGLRPVPDGKVVTEFDLLEVSHRSMQNSFD